MENAIFKSLSPINVWIKKEIPDSKIVIILRNPIDRAFSLYNWMIMEGYENANSFGKALQKERRRHVRDANLLYLHG